MAASGTSDDAVASVQKQSPAADSALYQKPFRTPVTISLLLVATMNASIFIFSCIVSHTIAEANHLLQSSWYLRTQWHNLNIEAVQTLIFLFWSIIPLVVWLFSSIELYRRWRRKLRPGHIVATSSISIALWLIEAGVWGPCVFSSYWSGYFKPFDDQPAYCPFPKGQYWYFSATYPSAPPRAYYVLIWLIIPTIVFHGIHLILGAVALNRDKHAQRYDSTLRKIDGRESAIEMRYKITSSVYTEAATVSEVYPSTLQSSIQSPGTSTMPSTGPPSYAGLSSNRSSLRSSSSGRAASSS